MSVMAQSSIYGYTYVVMLIAVALTSITAAVTANVTSSMMQREREIELIFRGQQYQLAIQRYYEAGAQRQYPSSLDHLTKDPRFSSQRHLRRLYDDPMAKRGAEHQSSWLIIRNDSGGIIGVSSQSDKRPIKQARFRSEQKHFKGADRYRDWTFIYRPKQLHAVQPVIR